MSAHVLLGHFRLWMSTVWVARWIGFKFLIPELIGKSKIRSLEVKEDENHKSTLFRDTLYINLNFILENFYWDDWDDFGRRGWPNLQLIQEAPTGSGYAVHFFDIIYFVKNSLSVPITYLNGQSGLVISNMSNRSQGTSNWLKIYWYIFHFCQKQLFCAYYLSKLSKWTCYIKNIPNRSQGTSNWLKI